MADDIGSIGSKEHMEPSRPTTRVLVTAMSSSGPSPLRAKEAEDADVEREVGRGPWRRPDPDPRSLPHSRRHPRDVLDARVRQHRDGLRRVSGGRLAPGAAVDYRRATDRDGGPPALGTDEGSPRLRGR